MFKWNQIAPYLGSNAPPGLVNVNLWGGDPRSPVSSGKSRAILPGETYLKSITETEVNGVSLDGRVFWGSETNMDLEKKKPNKIEGLKE